MKTLAKVLCFSALAACSGNWETDFDEPLNPSVTRGWNVVGAIIWHGRRGDGHFDGRGWVGSGLGRRELAIGRVAGTKEGKRNSDVNR